MDVAYDLVQEEALSPSEEASQREESRPDTSNINAEFQQAFHAVSSSPWGSKLGGWFTQARKQGESFYQDLQKEASEAQEQATKGFSSLREQVVQRTRGMSNPLNAEPGPEVSVPGEEAVPGTAKAVDVPLEAVSSPPVGERPDSLPADIVKEAGSLVASLRLTAAAKLKELQRAEDAADEALLKFGTNVRDFLHHAVTVSAPTGADSRKPRGLDGVGNEVLFETQEPGTGKKIFHTTRLDALLHAIHTAPLSFTEHPQGSQWDEWQASFDVDRQTESIGRDLNEYEQLRRAMESLVPEKVAYADFWKRYYFLRKAVEEEEKRRKEVLKGVAADGGEEIAWDDDEEESVSAQHRPAPHVSQSQSVTASTTTLNAPRQKTDGLKPRAPRRSNEEDKKSVADSDASYDMMSGATSRAAGSPREVGGKADESEDDWE